MDDEVRDRTAYELLSGVAAVRYARRHAEKLRLPRAYVDSPDATDTRVRLPRFLADCLQSSSATTREAAQSVGRRLGLNLGHILLALNRGDLGNRAARQDWTANEWEHWAGIQQVWLGGGLMSGALGELIMHHAQQLLAELGLGQRLQIAVAASPGTMALLGAGRYLPASTKSAICLDCGHTLLKRACLRFERGTLAGLQLFSPLAVEFEWPPVQADPSSVIDFVTSAITQTVKESVAAGFDPGPDVMLSVAAYVQEGRLLGNGLYAQISSGDVRPLLSGAAGARVGRSLRVHPIHDGTAAAALYAGQRHSAVILVGTAIGVGFPPADASGLRPLAPTLEDSCSQPTGS